MDTEIQNGLIITTSPLPIRSCCKLLRRALELNGFKVVAETQLQQGTNSEGKDTCLALVAWSPFFAYQSLLIDSEAGLLLPFCLLLQEVENAGSKVLSLDYRRVAATSPTLGARVLARVLGFQIQQVLWRVTSHDSCQQAVMEGGGEYRGVQQGSPVEDTPDLILFDDPATHTTLSLPLGVEPITASAVRKKIARSRSFFHEQRDTPSAKQDLTSECQICSARQVGVLKEETVSP